MTTGRINQVTVVVRRPTAHDVPPVKGGSRARPDHANRRRLSKETSSIVFLTTRKLPIIGNSITDASEAIPTRERVATTRSLVIVFSSI